MKPRPSHPSQDQGSGSVTLKHWRHFGAQEWRHVGDGVVGFLLGSALPLLSFYAALKWWSFNSAVLVMLAWSAVVFLWHRRRTGQSDVFSAVTFSFALLEALVGLISQNQFLYFATPSVKNVVTGLMFIVTAWLGKPLVGLYAQRLYPIPEATRASSVYKRAFFLVSVVWAIGLTLRGTVRIILLTTLPLEQYLFIDNTLVGWSFSAVLVSFTVWYPLRTLRRAGLIADRPIPIDAAEVAEEVSAVALTP